MLIWQKIPGVKAWHIPKVQPPQGFLQRILYRLALRILGVDYTQPLKTASPRVQEEIAMVTLAEPARFTNSGRTQPWMRNKMMNIMRKPK